jgi:hypothetical protein
VKFSVDNATYVQGLERVTERATGHQDVFLLAGCPLVRERGRRYAEDDEIVGRRPDVVEADQVGGRSIQHRTGECGEPLVTSRFRCHDEHTLVQPGVTRIPRRRFGRAGHNRSEAITRSDDGSVHEVVLN